MKSPFPRTLFGQTVLVLITGIGLALLAGILIWSSDRKEAVRIVGALALAERIVNVSRLVGDTPESWRSRLVNGASDPHFQVVLSESKPDITTSSGGPGSIIADFIRQALIDRTVDVSISQALSAQDGWMPGAGRGSGGMGYGRMGQGSSMHAPMMHGPLAHSGMSWSSLEAAVQLVDGKWLRFSTSLPDQGPAVSIRLILALGMIAVAIVLLSAWAVRRMTIPLDTLASAAIRLGRNVDTPSLDVKGTIEMRRAAEAFNDMQTRLRHLIENRTVMLAAISHDLRTQLTLLRLRAENADAGDDRDKMLKTISEMEDMLMATLSFAREQARNEDVRRVDVSALLASIADDMADAGLPVSQGPLATGVILDCKPTALRRAFTNLIDNAVKYGGSAKVGLSVEDHSVSIVVEDQGPGISADQIGLVTQPFYRIERSRNRESGGIGLGLAIVVSIVEAHGGCLKLSNRSGGGLSARVELPKGQLL